MTEPIGQQLAISAETSLSFGECLKQLRKVLAQAGFLILAEIPFHREFEQRLGLKWRRYTVLVVWSPFHAYQSVLNDTEAGVLLPFHFIVAEKGSGSLLGATNLSLLGQLTGRIGLRLVGNNLTRQIRQILYQLHSGLRSSTEIPAPNSKESA